MNERVEAGGRRGVEAAGRRGATGSQDLNPERLGLEEEEEEERKKISYPLQPPQLFGNKGCRKIKEPSAQRYKLL